MFHSSYLFVFSFSGAFTLGSRVYLHYMRAQNFDAQIYQWKVTGKDYQNDSSPSLIIRDLDIAVLYHGYLLYSIHSVGNGAPSEFIRFQTMYNRECDFLEYSIENLISLNSGTK